LAECARTGPIGFRARSGRALVAVTVIILCEFGTAQQFNGISNEQDQLTRTPVGMIFEWDLFHYSVSKTFWPWSRAASYEQRAWIVFQAVLF
jgi:hypothetical protein